MYLTIACAVLAFIAVVLSFMALRRSSASPVASKEQFVADILRSDYPRLIYNEPSYLPLGSTIGVNYNYPVPTSLPPHLVEGTYSPSKDIYVTGPVEWNVQP